MERCVLIPSYRPDSSLAKTVASMRAVGFSQVIVVDDGSGPVYAPFFEQAEQLGATVLRHAVNMGKGRALKTGFCHILAASPSCVAVTADGDGQHAAEDAWKAAELADTYPQALILGCRDFSKQKSIPLPNLIGNLSTRAAFFLLTGMRFTDTQCGLRAYPPAIMRTVCDITGDRFEFESNTLLACRTKKLPVVEFPITVHYAPGADYVTTYQKGADSARILRCLLNFALLPVLFGLLSSIIVLCLTAAAVPSRTAIGALAGIGVTVGKTLLALCSPKKLASFFHAIGCGIVYGALFALLISLGFSALGAFWTLFAPFSLLSFTLYRAHNYGRRPPLIRHAKQRRSV